MPRTHKCGVCARPLAPQRWALRTCEAPSCRAEWLKDRPREAARLRSAALFRAAKKHRNRSAAQRGIPADARDSYLVAVVPHNTDRPSRLPAARREAFLVLLRHNLVEARERLAKGETPVPQTIARPLDNGRSEAEQQAEMEVLGAGCGACRGNCCRQGGHHAFNTSDTMMHYLIANPTHDDETIVGRYDTLMPVRSFTHGCVFQQTGGCALPRELRSDVCNRFFCEYISVLRNQYAAGEPVRAYFVHQRGDEFHGGHFVEITVRRERSE